MTAAQPSARLDGILVVDKPAGPTSHDIVGLIRRLSGMKRVGHGGTLDPFARGVLPIFLGRATRVVEYHLGDRKQYRATVCFGASSTTDDLEGELTPVPLAVPGSVLERATVEAGLAAFRGPIVQVPPAYSAIKVDGERSYDLARAGQAVELAARIVTVHSARVAGSPDADHITLEIECGKGTYVRAIARDLAEMLGACGHVHALRRTRVGGFTEQNAVTLEFLEDLGYGPRQSELLLPVETALDDIPELAVTAEDAFRLKQGRAIVLVPRQVEAVKARLKPGSRTVSAMAGGSIVALCEMRAGRLEPSRVFLLESGD